MIRKLKTNIVIGNIILKNFIRLSSKEKMLILKWRNDWRVRKWCYTEHIITKKEHKEFIKKLKNDEKNFYWVVKSREGSYLGVVSLNKLDTLHKHAYLGIYSNPKFKGVGKILMRALKELAFKIAKLHTLKLEVIETNRHAIEFYKKQGFKEEGKLKEFVYKNNKWLDVIIMGIINEEN